MYDGVGHNMKVVMETGNANFITNNQVVYS